MKVFRKLIKIDKIFFNYYFYSRYKLKRNKTSLRKNFSHKISVYYDQEDQDLLSQLCIKYGSNKGGEWKHRNGIIRSFYGDLYD
jgi:hypothetical protein